ncbi:MAG: hypothetical protein V4633_13475 [Pseudomonadota bacterium]
MKTLTEVIESTLRVKFSEQAKQEIEPLFNSFRDELDKLGVPLPVSFQYSCDELVKGRAQKLLSDEFEAIASKFS